MQPLKLDGIVFSINVIHFILIDIKNVERLVLVIFRVESRH